MWRIDYIIDLEIHKPKTNDDEIEKPDDSFQTTAFVQMLNT